MERASGQSEATRCRDSPTCGDAELVYGDVDFCRKRTEIDAYLGCRIEPGRLGDGLGPYDSTACRRNLDPVFLPVLGKRDIASFPSVRVDPAAAYPREPEVAAKLGRLHMNGRQGQQRPNAADFGPALEVGTGQVGTGRTNVPVEKKSSLAFQQASRTNRIIEHDEIGADRR